MNSVPAALPSPVTAASGQPVYRVHFVLSAKGGVGKSLACFLAAQAHRHFGLPVMCFDAPAMLKHRLFFS
jgi:Mrp family chromosome partitioning ATPase